MKLNETQALAVNIKGQNTLVFASAGGGKTTVLIERLMKRILKDRVSLDEILAMTFTEAASNEMKKRLEKAINNAILEYPEDSFLSHQKTLLQDAHISTIHSFCLDLVKEYYYVIGLKKSRQNNILDEGTKKLYIDEAFDDVAFKYKELPRLNEVLTSSLFSFEDLKRYVLSIFKAANNHYDPLIWFKEKRNHEISSFNDLPQGIKDVYLQELKGQIQYAISIIDKIIDLHNEHEASFILKRKEFSDLLNENDYPLFEQKLVATLVKVPTIRKDEEYKALREELTNIFKTLAEKIIPPKALIKGHNASLEIEHLLFDLSEEVYLRYEAIKSEHDCIDFDDFEHFAYQILMANDEKIAKELKNRFKEIMIDEFQDTNHTQYKIASLIENQNLFLVGDIKQSIYRFRGAKPSIMQALKEEDSFFKIHIKNNYRSKENVVEYNNHLFLKLMNIFSSDYEEEDVQIAGLERQKEDNVPVQFIYIETDENIKELKAKRIANEILELYKKGERFKDMAVLVRGHNDKASLKKAFENYHIPYFINDNEGYYNSTSISILLSYLKCLVSKDPSFKVAILTSPLYACSDSDLIVLKANDYAYPPFVEDYKRLVKLAKENRLLDCVNEILVINDFYFKHLNLQERSNLDVFINDLKRLNFNTLYDLIDYIEETKEYQKDTASTISEEADVVKVMTIHNSKGLEFENVFFYSTSNNLQREKKDAVVVDDELGVGIRYSADAYKNTIDNISRIAILLKDNRDDLNEFVRLLYVALTRAKRRLYIVDGGKGLVDYPLNEALLYARKGFTSLIYNAMKEDPLMYCLKEMSVKDEVPLKKVTQIKKEIPMKEFKITQKESIAPSSLEIQDELNFDALKGMEYGTKVHAIFENLDFHKDYDEQSLKEDFKDIDQKTINAVLNFLRDPLIQEIKTYELIPEFSFYLDQKEYLYHGFMDFVAIGEDKVLLIDYKTDHEDDEAVFKHRYTPQINAYKEILVEIFKKEVDSYLYSSHLQKFIRI